MEYLYTTARGQVHIIEAASVRQAWQRASHRHKIAFLFEPTGAAFTDGGGHCVRCVDADVSTGHLAKLREQVGAHRVPQPDPLATAHDLLRRMVVAYDNRPHAAMPLADLIDEARALIGVAPVSGAQGSPIVRRRVISEPGAAIKVTELDLSADAKASLRTDLIAFPRVK